MDQNQSDEELQKLLKNAEESFKATENELNEVKLSLSALESEETVWRQILLDQKSKHQEKQNQLRSIRESLFKSVDTFVDRVEDNFQNSILDNFIDQLANQVSTVGIVNTAAELNLNGDTEINELKEKLKQIDIEIKSYESNAANQQNNNDDSNDEEEIIKRCQEATTSILESVQTIDKKIKIVTDQILKKRYPSSTTNHAKRIDPVVLLDNIGFSDTRTQDNSFIDNIYAEMYMDTDEIVDDFVANNSACNAPTTSTEMINNEICNSEDYLYSTSGIDDQIKYALNHNAGDQAVGDAYPSNYSYYDDHFDIVEMNNFTTEKLSDTNTNMDH